MSTTSRTNILGLSLDSMEQLVERLGEKPYRGRQLFQWVYQHGTADFAEMSNFSKSLRDKLQAEFEIVLPAIVREQADPDDGTRKFLIRLSDGAFVEKVLIPVRGRVSLCMSTQVGCPIGCRFCATGWIGFKRNLTPGEMIGQLMLARRLAGEKELANVVLMGMGEPLLNLDNVVKMIKIAGSELGLGFAARKFTISTVGLVKQIRALADYHLKAGLALSLHAPFQDLREKLIPTAKANPLGELIPACRDYIKRAGERVTLEYLMIGGITDTTECAHELARISHQLPCKINLIAYNPIPAAGQNRLALDRRRVAAEPLEAAEAQLSRHSSRGGKQGSRFDLRDFRTPSPDAIDRFREYLYPRCPAVTFRKPKGLKIAAACGQLAAQVISE